MFQVLKKSVKSSSDSDSDDDSDDEDDKSKLKQKTNQSKKNNKKVISSKKKKKNKATNSSKFTAKDKVKAAKARLKQMQKSGALQAPPRRAASLTAAAMVHFMYDEQQVPAKTNNNAKNTPG